MSDDTKQINELAALSKAPFEEVVREFETLMGQNNRVFLLGAGCSKCAKLPLMDELTDKVMDNGSLGNAAKHVLGYLKEQIIYDMLYFSDRPIAITPPLFMELKVIDAPPGVKGDTAQGAGTKSVVLETGLAIQVPLFINSGDILKIDTRDGKYIERVKK